MTYEELLVRLRAEADETYRVFHGRLLKNDKIKLLGVRVPVLRKTAREWKGKFARLATFPNDYYEVLFLKCTVASELPYEEFSEVVKTLVPLLDNWATCDCFQAKCIRQNKEAFLPFVKECLRDKREFVARYGLVTLLGEYMEREYLPLIYESVRTCAVEQYYVMMAGAWLTAEVLVKFYDEGVAWLKAGELPERVHNKAIQKARESFRLTKAQKEELKGLKREKS